MNAAARASPRSLSSAARSSASADAAGDRLGVERVEQHRGVADDLGQRACARRGDRAAARHRLERRQPEALVEAREDERRRPAVERDQLARRDAAEGLDALRQRDGIVPDPREHETQLRPLAAQERERLEQPRVVLVRPRARGVEEERLALDRRVGREALVVDAEVDRVDARRDRARAARRPAPSPTR